MTLARWLVLVVAVAACSLAGCGAAPDPAVGGTTSTPSVVPSDARPAVRASAVLHRWDRLRAEAYAAGDSVSLRRLYVPGSWAGARDVRNLRAYADRGLVVRGLHLQRLHVDVLPAAPGTLRLRVEERLAGGTVVGGGSRVRLPTGRLTERVVTLVHTQHGWQLRSVRRG